MMTEIQKFKADLIKEVRYDVERAEKCFDFIMKEDEKKAPCGKYNTMQDGVYLVGSDGKAVLFTGQDTIKMDNCEAIGVKMGERSIKIALKDEANCKDITLTSASDETDYSGYIDNYLDAVADWNGKANTEHLKEIGLNEEIKLKDGWYIPSLGEMYLIFLNRKEINGAMTFAGGLPIAGVWYWTSTEYSASGAWYLGLDSGFAGYYTKASDTFRVRAVSAFIS